MMRPRLTVRSIAKAVSHYYGIGWNDLASPRRTSKIVRARQVLIFLAREHTTLSLPQIGRHVGGRDHTTVLHSCRKIGHLRDIDPEMRQELRDIEEIVYEQVAPNAYYEVAPEPDTDPFKIADRIIEGEPDDWRLTASELRALAEAVILRQPIDEPDPDPVPVTTPEPAPVAASVPIRPFVPTPVASVLKAFRNLENARFSPRERGEREAFERALSTLSNHLNTESSHARH